MGLIKTLFFSCFLSYSILASVKINEPLYFSNYPERLDYPQTVFSESIILENVRFHYYHINKTSNRMKNYLSITNNESISANLTIINISNTHPDGSKLSFKNSYLFWNSILNNDVTKITLRPFETKQLVQKLVKPNHVSHGIIKINNPNRNKLLVKLTYQDNIYKKLPISPTKPVVFETLTKKDITVLPFGPKVIIPIGKKDRSKFSYNHGNYGQIHELNIRFINPYNFPLESTIYYHRISGMSRNNIIIDNKIFQTKYVLLDSPVEKIHTLTIDPNSTPSHKINLFPESGNFYPIEIIISSLKKPKSVL